MKRKRFYLFSFFLYPSLQETGLLYAIKKCLSNPSPIEKTSPNEKTSVQIGSKRGGNDRTDSECAITTSQMLAKLCVAGRGWVGDLKEQLCFHPMKVFRSLQKHRPDSLLPTLFLHWPAREQNPFVLPICMYCCMQSDDTRLPYSADQFIRIAETQCARQYPGIPLLIAALLFMDSPGRFHAARCLVAAGVDPNAIASTARLTEFAAKWRTSFRCCMFARIDEVTPLALAVTLEDLHLVRILIQLGANPCLVCFPFGAACNLFQYHYQLF